MNIKVKLLFMILCVLLCTNIFAEETQKTVSITDLTTFKWGTPSSQFFESSPYQYQEPNKDKGAYFYISKEHIMIGDLPFKQIVKLQPKSGLTSINYMHISNQESFESSCKNIYDTINKSFSNPTYQAVNSNPSSSFYVWENLNGTTMYEFCFSESALQTIIITVEPKWKIFTCSLDSSKAQNYYFYDEMNNIIREYAPNYISNALKTNNAANKIEFTSEKNSRHIVIDPKDLSYTIKNLHQKPEKGHCELK